jgi:hypothetical protein
VLDYGCGTGYGCPIITREALLHGAYLIAGGYDPDVEAIAFGRGRFWTMLTADHGEALDGGSLSAITCFNVLQHTGAPPADTIWMLLHHAPIVIGSVPREIVISSEDFPSTTSLTFLGQTESGMIRKLDPYDPDLIFIATRG